MKARTASRGSLAALALGAALLSGCSMMPAYQRPAAPVPADWAYPGAAVGTTASELLWQQFFTDEPLRRLIDIALRNNRDLRIAILNIEQARAQYDIRSADRLPTVGAVVSGSRTPNGSGGTITVYSAGLAITSWEVDLFGRVASLSEAALAQYLATEEGRKAAQTSLVATVATSWLGLVADQELLELTRQTLVTREESLRLAKLRFDNGVTSELDFRQAQSLVESSRVALVQLTRQQATDLDALALLLGQAVPPDLGLAATTASVSLPDLPAGTPSDVLARRPDVRAAEEQLIAANANIGAARAAFFPRISLTAGIGTASGELSGLFKGGSWGWTAAPQLLQPIFDAGRNRAGLASATAGREIAIAQYERAIQAAFREVSDALPAAPRSASSCARKFWWPRPRAHAIGSPSCATTMASPATWICWTASAPCSPRK
jgi:NodT family efflux transporter outer membrane factor (OMF) lipoprotein